VYYKGRLIDHVRANANGKTSLIFAVGAKKGIATISIEVDSKRHGKRFTVR